ncbi:hypothetical protein ACIP5Y_25525 [Nocardia sp. NPDC088792]|uniref:hypothetical protein n=1 Tax=Nocardia sp. NPDC088792 TaxID=3364332 RepID=UPI00381C56E3
MTAPGNEPQPQRIPIRGPIMAASIASAVAVLGIGAAITFGVLYSGAHDIAADRDSTVAQLQQEVSDNGRSKAATKAACDFAGLVGTYDAENLDTYFTAVINASTGTWRKNFSDGSDALKIQLTSLQARSQVAETHCGLAALDAHSAQVVVIVKQSRTNSAVPNPDALTVPMVLTLDEQSDGRWLVSGLSSPAL